MALPYSRSIPTIKAAVIVGGVDDARLPKPLARALQISVGLAGEPLTVLAPFRPLEVGVAAVEDPEKIARKVFYICIIGTAMFIAGTLLMMSMPADIPV